VHRWCIESIEKYHLRYNSFIVDDFSSYFARDAEIICLKEDVMRLIRNVKTIITECTGCRIID
jgi:hypothetical protein